MATENFPTLSRDINYIGYEETLQEDPTLRTSPEDGVVITRARKTANKKKFSFSIEYLTDADKTLLETFQDTVMVGSETFNWTRWKQSNSTAFVCRLTAPIRFYLMPTDSSKWGASFEMEEE